MSITVSFSHQSVGHTIGPLGVPTVQHARNVRRDVVWIIDVGRQAQIAAGGLDVRLHQFGQGVLSIDAGTGRPGGYHRTERRSTGLAVRLIERLDPRAELFRRRLRLSGAVSLPLEQ